jgi:hypothetical protein
MAFLSLPGDKLISTPRAYPEVGETVFVPSKFRLTQKTKNDQPNKESIVKLGT